jgi:hypothetical protein
VVVASAHGEIAAANVAELAQTRGEPAMRVA